MTLDRLSYTDEPDPDLLQVRDAEKAAALEAGATFIDHWIAGRTEELLGPDGDHPTWQVSASSRSRWTAR
ncbi:hypothetical protein SAMN04487913_10243 [Arthrobacter sp. ok362]|nr:hypothetical protein SAMN04487913_10243 [Arthrobacter sp. ok362]